MKWVSCYGDECALCWWNMLQLSWQASCRSQVIKADWSISSLSSSSCIYIILLVTEDSTLQSIGNVSCTVEICPSDGMGRSCARWVQPYLEYFTWLNLWWELRQATQSVIPLKSTKQGQQKLVSVGQSLVIFTECSPILLTLSCT